MATQTLDEPLTHGLAFSPDGAYLVGIAFDHLLIWRAADRKLRLAHEQPGASIEPLPLRLMAGNWRFCPVTDWSCGGWVRTG
ncbi:MAG: hypothetical protein R3E79_59250 [Caldilineaceae bacterium]